MQSIVFELFVIAVLIFCFVPRREKFVTKEEMENAARNSLLEKADIMSRKVRYENKSFATRIQQVVSRCFDEFKIIDNLILEDENGVEHQIPTLCATSKGVILFQTVDHPGKGLFGSVADEYWQIAQSEEMAQSVPNAAIVAIHNASMIKRITGIDVKPIAVISQYTPSEKSISKRIFGHRVILEEELESELMKMAKFGRQSYPPEFLTQVKEKLLAINISDEDDEEDIPVEDDVDDTESEDTAVPANA